MFVTSGKAVNKSIVIIPSLTPNVEKSDNDIDQRKGFGLQVDTTMGSIKNYITSKFSPRSNKSMASFKSGTSTDMKGGSSTTPNNILGISERMPFLNQIEEDENESNYDNRNTEINMMSERD